jgi:uncharacterized protein YdeI (YjbR/CyaY-like superfamily)
MKDVSLAGGVAHTLPDDLQAAILADPKMLDMWQEYHAARQKTSGFAGSLTPKSPKPALGV